MCCRYKVPSDKMQKQQFIHTSKEVMYDVAKN